ncbi:MAG: HAMP domain-containing histidine kinase [Hyphomicrobiales bacterium]|nr:HAMP domain-containing histidine kinase [Hyphomicrobiales bacterium]
MKRRRLSIGTALVLMNLAVLIVPLSGIWFLRLYQSALIRQTESELIAQAAIIAAVYRAAWHAAGGQSPAQAPPDPTSPRPAGNDDRWLPRSANLDLTVDAVLPPPPDPVPASGSADTAARQAGDALDATLRDAQRTTLAAIRVLDRDGVVVASTGEALGQSLTGQDEVQRALRGKPVSVLRERGTPAPSSPLAAIDEGSNLRVFTALPVLDQHRVIGVVLLSRTPRTLANALYGKRWHLAALAVLLLGSIGGLSALGTFAISRPLRAVTDQAKRTAEGERDAISSVTGPTVREVTELSEALRRMAQTLEDRADYIRSFAAHVSHEFKTPLTTIRGSVELLQEHFDSMSQHERKRFLHNLEAEAERLARLVTRLLDLARADVTHGAGHATTPASALITCIAERYRKNGLAVDASATEVLTLAIAEEALEMILVNLVENASQHADPQAHVIVSLRKQGDQAVLTVSDDGPGISSANAAHIFIPFFTTARKHGGTGLGLSIVQALARVHGGSVALLPSGNGATFEVRLPLAA